MNENLSDIGSFTYPIISYLITTVSYIWTWYYCILRNHFVTCIKFLLIPFSITLGHHAQNTTPKGELSQLEIIQPTLIINLTKKSPHPSNFNQLYYCLLGLFSSVTVYSAFSSLCYSRKLMNYSKPWTMVLKLKVFEWIFQSFW